MKNERYSDFFNVDIADIDSDIDRIIRCEEERQSSRLVLIPSESIAPHAVRQALGSVFNNVYAEGYPRLQMTREEESLVLEHAHQLSYYRRYADRRFYKGTEFANFVEVLAQRRAAQCFATPEIPAENILVNVQPLSGAAANLAVYQTFLQPGDVLMGLNLFQGGHLTHGSEFNLSGRLYDVVSYSVDPKTERLDYDAIMAQAHEHRPKIIVAGYTSYPWAPDWAEFRRIADGAGALLMADIAHTAGMASAGAYPTPVGYADVITFTTHKTICGPRGAVIMTTDEDKAQLIDAAVFPGEQGGPHVNKFAAMAVAFKIAQTDVFHRLQHTIVENARAFADSLAGCGLKLAYGGTDTHLLLVDLRPIKTESGFPLRGEMAARILDLCGVVVNKNTIPGDEITALASGIRMGTPWVTQRGFQPEHFDELARVIARVLLNIQPFRYEGQLGELPRAKLDLDTLESAKRDVASLAARIAAETEATGLGYPYHTIVSKEPAIRARIDVPAPKHQESVDASVVLLNSSDMGVLRIRGWRARPFVQQVSTNNAALLADNHAQRTFLLDKDGTLLDDVTLIRLEKDARGRDNYVMLTTPENTQRIKSWLRGLSDGYVLFDNEDIFRKVEGPVVIEDLSEDQLVDPEAHTVNLTVLGSGASKMLRELGVPNLEEGMAWSGQVGGASAMVTRIGYGRDDVRFELLAHPEQATGLWAKLTEAGAEPATAGLRQSLRMRALLPDCSRGRPSAQELYKGPHRSLFSLSQPYFVGQSSLKQVRVPANKREFAWHAPENPPLKRTPLYEEHRTRTSKIIPFAGWEMPVWYTSVGNEHRAVRSAAGLFDVAHMGVLEVLGEHAASFMDTVSSNYARWIDPGQSAYAYLLHPDGRVIDDFMMYRLTRDRYLLIVNAVNAEKDLAWLRAVNSRQFILDRENPAVEIEGEVTVRDLKDLCSGTDRRVDLALQGPNSLAILESLTQSTETHQRLVHIRRTEHARLNLAGFDLIVARTGYTGEELGFELLVHPDQATTLWNLLLAKGAPLGIKPCGLGARDSTRIEAGLPLYGHELAGSYDISPSEAGFAPYVKLHKPFFVGRKHCLDIEFGKKMEVARFRVSESGVRALRADDPVVNKRGQCIGHVTSCTLVGGRQIGLAYVDKRYNEPGTEIGLFPLHHGKQGLPKAPENLAKGDRIPLHIQATVLTRFPEDEEKAAWIARQE
jgi:glycine cleavage system T protein